MEGGGGWKTFPSPKTRSKSPVLIGLNDIKVQLPPPERFSIVVKNILGAIMAFPLMSNRVNE